MKIEVFSRAAIEEFKTDEKHIVISVRSPKTNPAFLPPQKFRLGAIFLEFHDMDRRDQIDSKDCEICGGTGFIKKWRHIENGQCFRCNRSGINLLPFCNEHAKIILDFVETYKNKVDLIAVNCEAGISRSAGISAALSWILNDENDDYYFKNYLPNRLVYRKIINSFVDRNNEEK